MKTYFNKKLGRILLIALPALIIAGTVYAAAGNIDSNNKWAWANSAGWLNFAPAHGGVTVYDDHLEGYVWAENIGWIRLGAHTGGGAHTYANDAADTYGVNNDGEGNLSGYAWSSHAGWINFNPAHGGVTIDPESGFFDGYAWGENIGWIHFKNAGILFGGSVYVLVTSWTGDAPAATIAVEDTQPATGPRPFVTSMRVVGGSGFIGNLSGAAITIPGSHITTGAVIIIERFTENVIPLPPLIVGRTMGDVFNISFTELDGSKVLGTDAVTFQLGLPVGDITRTEVDPSLLNLWC